MRLVPVSAIIPTKDRPAALVRALQSLLASTVVPAQFVIVDASSDGQSLAGVKGLFAKWPDGPAAVVQPATRAGAAAQRNQAIALATHEYVLFCDDDILCEADCVERLWTAMEADSGIGGASAAIVNQSYARPGFLMRGVLAALGEAEGAGYAGRIVGPAISFLPRLASDEAGNADVTPVQWINLVCTLCRRSVMPSPPFDSHFHGYSIAEDVALSLRIASRARLVNVPSARIFHDSQPGAHKSDPVARSRMELVNRHYIVTHVMQKRGWSDALRLVLWECCQLAVCALQQRGGALFWQQLWGKALGTWQIVSDRPASGRQ